MAVVRGGSEKRTGVALREKYGSAADLAAWQRRGKESRMRTVNPATGKLVREYEEHSPEQVERALDRARAAFATWHQATFVERGRLMEQVAAELRRQSADLAVLMAVEMGKPVVAGEREIEKCARVCEFYAEQAANMLRTELVPSDATESFVRFDPLGLVLAIMPWNFPFWQVFRFAAPALMAGNVGVLKHASNVPGCALAIEGVFEKAGFAPGVFTTLLVDAKSAAKWIAHPAISAVTLTGSEAAGRSVAATAGQHLKKAVLELGGSDAFIVLADADLERAAEHAAEARTINSGQSCIAAKRFIVERDVLNAFTERFVEHMRKLKVGDPRSRETDVGPLAREDLVTELHAQLRDSLAQGAELRLGGEPLKPPGYFYAPSVLARVTPGMRAFDEETFGPLAAVCAADDPDHALELANASRYGLGASVWTADRGLAKRLAGRLEAGVVFVNGVVQSDQRLPFGGVKASGFGRELSSFGIREFVNVKTVWVA
ncbi:MAG TPA: NAD-dependent succinate-semialdehyde dehydrogenase [Polyangiaceae bacterium]|nr:NAD-dependent succinate-semialdehyde dehydrogenase [Polyangiaceae bacterium]